MPSKQSVFATARWLTKLLLIAAFIAPPLPARAFNVSWPQATSLVLPGTGITLTIDAGSQADSLTINPSSFTVSVAAAESFTVRYPGPSYGTMSNDGAINTCNIVGQDNVAVVSGPMTVTFTPSTSTCTPPSSGGGGGSGANPQPSIRLYAPNGGEVLVAGSVYRVFWTYTGSQARFVAISLSLDGAAYERKTSSAELSQGYFDLTLPSVLTDTTARMSLELLGDGGSTLASDVSDGSFTIDAPDAPLPPTTPGAVPGSLPDPYDPLATITSDKALVDASNALSAFCATRELIKLQDDGNSATQHDSAVYYCGQDGKRYTFPNARVYATWYVDFSKVSIVTSVELSALPLGGNVTYRPGARLIKIQSDPKTYAVGVGGVLRHVPDEATAIALFGASWYQLIDDVDVAFFQNYRIGQPLASVAG